MHNLLSEPLYAIASAPLVLFFDQMRDIYVHTVIVYDGVKPHHLHVHNDVLYRGESIMAYEIMDNGHGIGNRISPKNRYLSIIH